MKVTFMDAIADGLFREIAVHYHGDECSDEEYVKLIYDNYNSNHGAGTKIVLDCEYL